MSIDHPAATSVALPSTPDGWHNLSAQVLNDGTIAIMRCERDFWGECTGWHAVLDRRPWCPPPVPPDRIQIAVFDGEQEVAGPVLPWADFSHLDRLASGEWLVVGARSHSPTANARIYSPQGQLVRSFHAGDGIAQIIGADDGSIWISYFDEGIFGGDQQPDGSWPVASSGLARFSPEGQMQWGFNEGLPFDHRCIGDCYALSTSGQDLWACYYQEFPIARIRDGEIVWWDNTIRGANSIAASGQHVLLAGGYPPNEGRVVLLRLEEERAVTVSQFTMSAPPRGSFHYLGGRNGTLHWVGNGFWHSLRVSDCIP